jgi:DNA-damage-inducible protein J
MAQTSFTIRMDEDVKRDFNALCENIGLTMTAAFCVFAKKAIAEQRIPFELTANPDPFYSEANMKHLTSIINGIENGTRPLVEHELIEVNDDEAKMG